jgi:hypothetical protein
LRQWEELRQWCVRRPFGDVSRLPHHVLLA